jgi:hypothetical protein
VNLFCAVTGTVVDWRTNTKIRINLKLWNMNFKVMFTIATDVPSEILPVSDPKNKPARLLDI